MEVYLELDQKKVLKEETQARKVRGNKNH